MKELFNKRLVQADEILIPRFVMWSKANGAKYNLTLGEPDFDTPDVIKEATIKAIHDNKTKYSLNLGNQDFREKIVAFEKSYNQIDYDKDEVLVTAGSTEGITIALLSILNEGDEVILLSPTYPLYPGVIEFTGAKVVKVDTSSHNFQIDEESLNNAISDKTKAIIITSPGNPTGTILSDESLELVYQAAKKHQFFVISDECYNQIVFEEVKPGIAKYSDIKDLVIVAQSLSKPYSMSGWRLGYLLGGKEFISQAMKVHQYVIAAVNTFIQDGGIAALDFQPKELVDTYKRRCDYVYDRLIKMNLEVVKPQGAFYIFPSIEKYKIDSWTFCERLVLEESVALMPGICFDADGFIRLSYCVDDHTIEEALNGLERFISKLEVK